MVQGARSPAGAGPLVHPHRRAQHPELENPQVAERTSWCRPTPTTPWAPRCYGLLHQAVVGRGGSPRIQASSTQACSMFWPQPRCSGGDETVGALPTLLNHPWAPTLGRVLTEAPVGRHEAPPPPLHGAESLHVPDRLETHLHAGGEVGHAEPGNARPRRRSAVRLLRVGRPGPRPSVVERDDGVWVWGRPHLARLSLGDRRSQARGIRSCGYPTGGISPRAGRPYDPRRAPEAVRTHPAMRVMASSRALVQSLREVGKLHVLAGGAQGLAADRDGRCGTHRCPEAAPPGM